MEQARGRSLDVVRRERGVVVGRFGGRQLDAALPLGQAPAADPPGALLRGPERLRIGSEPGEEDPDHDQPDQHERAEAVADQRDPEQELEHQVEREAAAATATASAAPAEAGRASAGRGKRRGRGDQRERDRREEDQERAAPAVHEAAASASGPCARLRLAHVLVGVIAASHERAGGDVLEPELVRGPLELRELVGVPVADDRQVVLGRPQVLTDREHLDVVLAQRAERVDHLLERLAQPDHQPGLRDDLVAAELLGVLRTRHERLKVDPRRATG